MPKDCPHITVFEVHVINCARCFGTIMNNAPTHQLCETGRVLLRVGKGCRDCDNAATEKERGKCN